MPPSVKSPRPRRRGVGFAIASCLLVVAALVGPLSAGAGAAPDAPICPATSGNARFVRYIYLNILERCPGEAAAKFWTDKLDAGGLRWGFTESIDMSNENLVTKNVVPLYQEVLGRAPTGEELAAGVARIRKDHNDGPLVSSLFASDEAYAKVPGATPVAKDQAWLKEAFKNVLERAPHAYEVTKYTGVLGTSGSTADTRYRVALRLELSNANMADWTGAAVGAALHRAPTDADFGRWYGWLLSHDRQTFRLWTQVLSTPEAYALAQTQPNPPPPGEH